jgi:hypothetical protein
MPNQVPCPKCGALVCLTDSQCLACGVALDEGQPNAGSPPRPLTAPVAAPPVAPPAAPPTRGASPPAVIYAVAAVTIGGALLGGGLGVLWGLLSAASCMGDRGGSGMALQCLGLATVALLLAGVAVALACRLLRGACWARWALIVLLAAEAVGAIVLVARGSTPLVWFLIPIGLMVAALFTRDAREYCAPRTWRESSS